MADTPKHAVVFLLDRSGSMDIIKGSTIENFNAYLHDLKTEKDLTFTLVQFDSVSRDIVHYGLPIAEMPLLTAETFEPRAGTPLIDAAVLTIRRAQEVYKPDDKVIITILTDGHENASRKFAVADLHELIAHVESHGWEVMYIGAGIDAYHDAGLFGIAVGKTMSYDAHDREASAAAYGSMSYRTRRHFAGGDIDFAVEEKRRARDRYMQEK